VAQVVVAQVLAHQGLPLVRLVVLRLPERSTLVVVVAVWGRVVLMVVLQVVQAS
jgi:hypothetical protein